MVRSRCAQAAGLTNMGSGGFAQAHQLIEQEADKGKFKCTSKQIPDIAMLVLKKLK